MFKRSQKQVSEGSQHWYQDKYQHVLVQRNVLALVAVLALGTSIIAVFGIMQLAPLKSVEPYLLSIDEKTGITQKVNPVTRAEYAANEAVDRYFTSQFITLREGYNPSVLYQSYNIVRLMSSRRVFDAYRRQVDPSIEGSLSKTLGADGRRDVKIQSLIYITNPGVRGVSAETTASKIMQARIVTTDSRPNAADVEQAWLVTITFEYTALNINEQEQLLNPLGYQVTSYQIQREVK